MSFEKVVKEGVSGVPVSIDHCQYRHNSNMMQKTPCLPVYTCTTSICQDDVVVHCQCMFACKAALRHRCLDRVTVFTRIYYVKFRKFSPILPLPSQAASGLNVLNDVNLKPERHPLRPGLTSSDRSSGSSS